MNLLTIDSLVDDFIQVPARSIGCWAKAMGKIMTSPAATDRKCLQTALRILTRRDHSIQEIKQKLQHRGYQTDAIKDVIAECIRWDYLNEERAAQHFVLALKRQGFGPHRITQKLKAKGIADNLITTALAKHLDTEEQAHVCQRVLAKKLKASGILIDSPQAKEKMHRFLFNRGFSPDTIHQVISAQTPS